MFRGSDWIMIRRATQWTVVLACRESEWSILSFPRDHMIVPRLSHFECMCSSSEDC
jgi:hypothetical protein